MRFRVFILAAAAVLVTGGSAFAQSQGAGNDGGSRSHAGGSSVSSGNSSSSASISSSGSAGVGVVQGNVAEGGSGNTASSGGGDQSGSAGSGSGIGGQGAGAVTAPNAATDGVLRQLDLPAVGTTADATPVRTSSTSNLYLWAAAGLLVGGLALLYRRLPRPTSA